MEKKTILLSIIIALIFALFIGYGIEVFHNNAEREDYCGKDLYLLKNESACLNAGGEWENMDTDGIIVGSDEANINNPEIPIDKLHETGYCHEAFSCYDAYDLARANHDKIVFIVSIIIGLLAVIFGIVFKTEVISTGILSGGILLILYGTIRYWQYADKILKFVLLGIVLVILIWLGYKKFDSKK